MENEDIVQRLNVWGGGFSGNNPDCEADCDAAAKEIVRLREKCNSRTRWLQSCMRARYEQLTDGAQEFADALFDEELEPEPPEVK